MLNAQPRQLPRTAYPIERGVEPQRYQNRRVGLRVAGLAFAGLDGVEQRGEVEALHHAPDQAGQMVIADQFVQRHRAQLHLLARRADQARFAAVAGLRFGLLRQFLEQLAHAASLRRINAAANHGAKRFGTPNIGFPG
ncbi:MAG: hypothetical protein ACREFJ_01495 [Acetobacteraceae bacterium]